MTILLDMKTAPGWSPVREKSEKSFFFFFFFFSKVRVKSGNIFCKMVREILNSKKVRKVKEFHIIGRKLFCVTGILSILSD